MQIEIEIPPLSYFESGNPFTGSHGQTFRFSVANKENQFVASVWYEDICFDLAKDREEETFPLTEEGRASVKTWLLEKCQTFWNK